MNWFEYLTTMVAKLQVSQLLATEMLSNQIMSRGQDAPTEDEIAALQWALCEVLSEVQLPSSLCPECGHNVEIEIHVDPDTKKG
jgi:hypothetical protein